MQRTTTIGFFLILALGTSAWACSDSADFGVADGELGTSEEAAATGLFDATAQLDQSPCLNKVIGFNAITTHNGYNIRSYRLLRDGIVVREMADPDEDDGVMFLLDAGFTPATNDTHQYKVQVENTQGQTSTSAALSVRAETCQANGTTRKKLVAVRLLPEDIPSEQVVGKALLEKVLVTNSKSLQGYLRDVFKQAWQPTVSVLPTAYRLAHDLAYYQELREQMKYLGTIGPELGDIKAFAIEENPTYATDTLFLLIMMGTSAGESGDQYIRLGGDDFLDNTSFEGRLKPAAHEIGHQLGFEHAAGITCGGNHHFGPDFTAVINDCAPSAYADPYDPMGSNAMRRYSVFSQWIFGSVPGQQVLTIRPLTASAHSARLKVYEHTTPTTDQVARLIRVVLDDAGSSIYLDYRQNVGYDKRAGSASAAYVQGIYTYYRPGTESLGANFEIQTYAPEEGDEGEPVAEGEVATLEDSLGLRVNVLDTTPDYAEVRVSWLSDPTCQDGIPNGDVCCLASCGTCGGSGCGSRPGGAAGCCVGTIREAGNSCTDSYAPCIIE